MLRRCGRDADAAGDEGALRELPLLERGKDRSGAVEDVGAEILDSLVLREREWDLMRVPEANLDGLCRVVGLPEDSNRASRGKHLTRNSNQRCGSR